MHNNQAKQNLNTVGDYTLNCVKKDKEFVLTITYLSIYCTLSQIRLLCKCTKYLALSMKA
jgi:hypothetical protein